MATTIFTRDWMPKKNKKNNYALGPILMAFGLVIGIAALIGDNPIANVVNPVLEPIIKPIVDAISGTQPAPQNPGSSNGNQPSSPSDSNPSTPSAPASGGQKSGPQKTSSPLSNLPPAISSNLPQKVGSAVIFGGSVQKVELQR